MIYGRTKDTFQVFALQQAISLQSNVQEDDDEVVAVELIFASMVASSSSRNFCVSGKGSFTGRSSDFDESDISWGVLLVSMVEMIITKGSITGCAS